MSRRRLPCAVLGRNPAHVRRFHCGSFGWSFLAQASQGSSLSALALGLRSRPMCWQKAWPGGWDRPTNHCCWGQGVFFVGDWDLLCQLIFLSSPPLSSRSLPLPSSLLFHFGLTSCSLFHFRPRRLITSKEPLKLIS